VVRESEEHSWMGRMKGEWEEKHGKQKRIKTEEDQKREGVARNRGTSFLRKSREEVEQGAGYVYILM